MKKDELIIDKNEIKKHIKLLILGLLFIANYYIFIKFNYRTILTVINLDFTLLIGILVSFIYKQKKSISKKETLKGFNILFLNLITIGFIFIIFILLIISKNDGSVIVNKNITLINDLNRTRKPANLQRYVNSVSIFFTILSLVFWILAASNYFKILETMYNSIKKIIFTFANAIKRNIQKIVSWFKYLLRFFKNFVINDLINFSSFLFNRFIFLILFKLNKLNSFYRWSIIP
ncbi:hypothetical protein SLITO_v1c10080 [Spiroplasma litorale]|uniref:Transmembrane protein n=1 Tax=Spiroplasma litorale TaxID=216942 RepID=A0A0K1W2R8_9MOLU|nr:hypothetical protein [Spiroplasma litorale]AKX34619.1 hypothetical protein SLITO_v1c10080 [Spiroplasma litorale]